MILISTIGTGKYEDITYQFRGITLKKGKYIVKALQEHFKPDKILILMTEESIKIHESSLKNLCNFETVIIKTGKEEQDSWEMFDSIVNKIPENESLIIDVTHGFRSQPMLLLAIAVFLQIMKNVKIEHILYGAFDAKDENGIAPIFELKPFLELIQWSFATEHFIKRGDAKLLSELIINIHQEARNNNNSYKPEGLKSLGQKLDKITKALALVRPKDFLELTNTLPANIEKSSNDIENLKKSCSLRKIAR